MAVLEDQIGIGSRENARDKSGVSSGEAERPQNSVAPAVIAIYSHIYSYSHQCDKADSRVSFSAAPEYD